MDLDVLRINRRWLGRACLDLLLHTRAQVWDHRLYSSQLAVWAMGTRDGCGAFDARTRDRIEAVLARSEVLDGPRRAERLLLPLAGNLRVAEAMLRVQLQPHVADPPAAGLLLAGNALVRISEIRKGRCGPRGGSVTDSVKRNTGCR